MVKQGDTIKFKKPKRNPIYGCVDHIENDITKMYWTEGEKPRYIRVAVDTIDADTGEIKGYQYLWVREKDITYIPKATK